MDHLADERVVTAEGNKGTLPAGLPRLLLVLIPSLYFVLIFWPALFEGKTYGNRPNQERLATELNSYYSKLPAEASPPARWPEAIHPDYELLYQPTDREIQSSYRNGRLPLYNPRRLLGTIIWGSPVADPANPLTLLLLLFSQETVHMIKIYIYTVLAFYGVFLCCTVILGADPLSALIGSSVYLLNPFMYYMFHWASLYGVVSLVPLLLCLAHLCFTRPRFLYLALFEVLLAWVLLINQLQALLYFFLFLALWLSAGLALKLYQPRALRFNVPLLGASALGGLALSFGHTWYVAQSGAALARQQHTYQALASTRPRLLDIGLLLGMWWGELPLRDLHYDASLVFFPVTVLVVIAVGAGVAFCFRGRARMITAALLILLAVHLFAFPLHYPLYLIHLPLYNLNWEHWRSVYLFYFLLSMALAVALTGLTGRSKLPGRWAISGVCAIGAAVYAFSSLAMWLHSPDRLFLPLMSTLGLVVMAHGFSGRFSSGHTTALGLTVIASCLYMPMTRVPFYQSGSGNDFVPGPPVSGDLTRTMRLVDFSQILRPAAERIWFSDAVMAMFSRNGATGYDTALQRNEAQLFACFYSPDLQRLRREDPFLSFGVQSSIVFPEAEGILNSGGATLSRLNQARLQILGVSSLLWKTRIANIAEARWDPVLQAWDHSLQSPAPVNVLSRATVADTERLFSPSAGESLGDDILTHRAPASLRFDERSGSYWAGLPAGTGLVVISYNIGRLYRPFIGGSVPYTETSKLPFLLIRKFGAAPAALELRPETAGIWIRIAAGLVAGALVAAALRRLAPSA